ncbi:amidohydrolase family protein [Solimonas soli]|uniref:amidohydrolase family protein n=1 Tax=Solimonas soli TaxID=413479 RepID=UPI000485227C|nr:amidohydrolase family protein [Solimonas soli]
MNSPAYPIYDADQHYYETPDAFLRYLPKQFKKEFQYVTVNGRTKLAVGGVLSEYIPNPAFEVVAAPGAHEKWFRGQNPEGLSLREIGGKAVPSDAAFHSGPAHLKELDKNGVHASILLPTLASVIEERLGDKPDVIAALFHSLNQWVRDEYGFANGRQFPVAAINLANLELALKELDFVIEAGARVVLLRPAPVPGLRGSRSFGFKEFDPFWARCAEAKILVALHTSDTGYDRIYQWWTQGGAGETRPFEKDPFKEVIDVVLGRPIQDALAALICHGVFDRHPGVRVASLENGSSWLEPLLKRFESTYHKMPRDFKTDPVEAFRRHVYVAPFYEDSVRTVANLIGMDRVLFGSDWPHPEGLAKPLDFFRDIEDLNAEEQQMVMSSNLKALLEGDWK